MSRSVYIVPWENESRTHALAEIVGDLLRLPVRPISQMGSYRGVYVTEVPPPFARFVVEETDLYGSPRMMVECILSRTGRNAPAAHRRQARKQLQRWVDRYD